MLKNSLLLVFTLVYTSVSSASNGSGNEPGLPHLEKYYAAASDKQGAELKAELHKIIDGHKVFKYTISGNDDWYDGLDVDVWEALTYTDSACGKDEPTCGMVKMLYLNKPRHISKANRGIGANDSWEREHVWPKSRGFKKPSQDGYTDLHHLRPADRNLNGAHSNFGYDLGGDVVMDTLADGSKVVTSARIDRENESFEPTFIARGQIARMLFYMAVRYEAGDDGPKEKMPDLFLVDDNLKTSKPLIGDLCTLLMWHNRYQVSAFERRRNDRVFELQHNRNPFIDYPNFANRIWAEKCPIN